MRLRRLPKGTTRRSAPGCWVALFIVAQVAACALPGNTSSVVKKSYTLTAPGSPAAASDSSIQKCASLRISRPVAAPGFATARMAYVQDALQLRYFAYHDWVETPARMLQQILATESDRSGIFAAVLVGSPDLRARYRLDAEGISILQRFNANESSVSMSVKLILVDVANRALIASRQFDYIEVADAAGPEAGVAAANRAARRLGDDLQGFLSQALRCTNVD